LTLINILSTIGFSDIASLHEEHLMTTTTHSPSAQAQAGHVTGTWRVDAVESQARFTARTMAGLVSVPGRFRTLAGTMSLDERGTSGALALEAASIDTGNRLRDRHLRSSDFLDAAKHPEVRYELESLELDGARLNIEGELLVAGTRTRLPLAAELRRVSDDAVEIACSAQLDRLELGVRGARGVVPRSVAVEIALVLRRA
jgi:polyisoprenoid-binding protein YceI